MSTVTANDRALIHQIASAIVETVRESGPLGAPGGILYSAFMAHGISLASFEALMDVLVRVGQLRKSGHCYFVV